MIKGINVLNPVKVEKEYLLHAVEYAAEHGFSHIQINGPIHNVKIANIDGMTPCRKYSEFNGEKDMDYINQAIDAVNAGCAAAKKAGIRMYIWHHELELPSELGSVYPQVLNSGGDIEVSHPLVKDYLEHKIKDFFYYYPMMDGIVLTLHETKIPLLKLKNQKLDKVERVKYVTEILYNAVKEQGRELIVRPFASVAEDYEMMARGYEEISPELVIMDKWTQFDWSLTLPHNAFFSRIKNNPLLVEGDIFGEFFGKGRLPLMLKEHLREKLAYCDKFAPRGYVLRIDRNGDDFFGDVNEVNLKIANAYLSGEDAEKAIESFFRKKYPHAWGSVMALMEKTEDIVKKTIYLNGYYFTELSLFPTLNHCKNHYYFHMMRREGTVNAEEWYIPEGWERGSLHKLLREKQDALREAEGALCQLELIEDKITPEDYKPLWIKFCNLKYVAMIWKTLTEVIMAYVKYFETGDASDADKFAEKVAQLRAENNSAKKILGDKFYGMCGDDGLKKDFTEEFAQEVVESFEAERKATNNLLSMDELVDYIVCGGAMEGHELRKEVNFSDTLIEEGVLCRIAGNRMGEKWSSINSHGWFSYEVNVAPNRENTINIIMNGAAVAVTVDGQRHEISEGISEKREITLNYKASKNKVRIRFDKTSPKTPHIEQILIQCKLN